MPEFEHSTEVERQSYGTKPTSSSGSLTKHNVPPTSSREVLLGPLVELPWSFTRRFPWLSFRLVLCELFRERFALFLVSVLPFVSAFPFLLMFSRYVHSTAP